jgi:hypothetical protein
LRFDKKGVRGEIFKKLGKGRKGVKWMGSNTRRHSEQKSSIGKSERKKRRAKEMGGSAL